MSTPKLKKGPEDTVRILIQRGDPLSAGAQRKAYLTVNYAGIYTIQSGRIQEGRGDHTLQVMAGRGDSGVGGSPMGGGGVITGYKG